MKNTVSLPNRDRTRKLSPLVLEAVSNGAIASLDPADPNGTLILTFDKPAQAKAFKASVDALVITDNTDALAKLADAVGDSMTAEFARLKALGEGEPEA